METNHSQAGPTCPDCGTRIAREYLFCPACGTDLRCSVAWPPDRSSAETPSAERLGSEEMLDHWSLWIIGTLLLIASLAAFYVCLVVLGPLAAWAIGICTFALGLILAGRVFGGIGKAVR